MGEKENIDKGEWEGGEVEVCAMGEEENID